MLKIKKLDRLFYLVILGIAVGTMVPVAVLAGGGLVLKNDVCIIEIDFYTAHFTAYQPKTRGNEQFCQELPDTGETLFVLDYLHPSLREVPVSLRIIHDVTGQGSFVKLKHVEEIENIEDHTVFYQPPVIRSDASFQVDFDVDTEGSYIGIVTAGHPTSDEVYTAVFPFDVGGADIKILLPIIFLVLTLGFFLLRHWSRVRKVPAHHGTGT
ncbi:MAG: hypothetical protein GQ538_12990 [Xanthomonadales bacterium]|nr:hypothetical protein [Xanthomonadales bacterium]